jgi:hypothetical protein
MNAIRTIEITHWRQFLDHVEPTGPFATWAFRGETNAKWELRTSLARYLTAYGVKPEFWPYQEARMVRVFKRKARLFLPQPPRDADNLHWLGLMQHHGAPTRLLDFTWSPYVAAFFALEGATKPAAVWAVDPSIFRREWASRMPGAPAEEGDLRRPGVFQAKYLENHNRFLWQGEPMVMNQRLITQNGTFIVPSTLHESIENLLLEYPGGSDAIAKFIFDTQRVRSEAMRSLYSMNITNASLFPDLDGLARSMAYELEFHWAFDPLTGAARAGLKSDPQTFSLQLDTEIDSP